MTQPNLTPDRIKQLVDMLLQSSQDPLLASNLLELLAAVTDSSGDPLAYSFAQHAMRHAFTYTSTFEKVFKDYLNGGMPTEVRDDDIH